MLMPIHILVVVPMPGCFHWFNLRQCVSILVIRVSAMWKQPPRQRSAQARSQSPRRQNYSEAQGQLSSSARSSRPTSVADSSQKHNHPERDSVVQYNPSPSSSTKGHTSSSGGHWWPIRTSPAKKVATASARAGVAPYHARRSEYSTSTPSYATAPSPPPVQSPASRGLPHTIYFYHQQDPYFE